MHGFIEDLKSRIVFENLASLVTQCTRHCVASYENMYLDQQEEICVKNCYLKQFEFQTNLN
jgi:Tim10/DDP family zinc finger